MPMSTNHNLVGHSETVDLQTTALFQIPLDTAITAKNTQAQATPIAGGQTRGHQCAGNVASDAHHHENRVFQRPWPKFRRCKAWRRPQPSVPEILGRS